MVLLSLSVLPQILVAGTDKSRSVLVKGESECVCRVASDRVKFCCRRKAVEQRASLGPLCWWGQEQRFLIAPQTFIESARSRKQSLCNSR